LRQGALTLSIRYLTVNSHLSKSAVFLGRQLRFASVDLWVTTRQQLRLERVGGSSHSQQQLQTEAASPPLSR
jgi:hypothetical protein